jgi:hypothetical protein
LPVYRALADCGLAGLPEQSSGPSPLVHVPDEGPAGRASNIGGSFLRILRGGARSDHLAQRNLFVSRWDKLSVGLIKKVNSPANFSSSNLI